MSGALADDFPLCATCGQSTADAVCRPSAAPAPLPELHNTPELCPVGNAVGPKADAGHRNRHSPPADVPPHEHKRDISKDRGDDIFCACGEQLPRVTPLPADAPRYNGVDLASGPDRTAYWPTAPAQDAPYEMQGRKDYEPIKQYEIGPLSVHGPYDAPPYVADKYAHLKFGPNEAPARDALVDRLNAEADAITCYASTTTEHAPNRTAMLLREAAAALAQRDVPRAEPVAWYCPRYGHRSVAVWSVTRPDSDPDWQPLYAAPPERSAAQRDAPREPDESMLRAGALIFHRIQSERIPRWESRIAERFWIAMHDDWKSRHPQERSAAQRDDNAREPTDAMRSVAFNYAEGFAGASTVTAQEVLDAYYAIRDAAMQEGRK